MKPLGHICCTGNHNYQHGMSAKNFWNINNAPPHESLMSSQLDTVSVKIEGATAPPKDGKQKELQCTWSSYRKESLVWK